MQIVIKGMETEAEIQGKAFVHWKAWHEAYPALINRDYLDGLTLEKCEAMAHKWTDGILVAKDGDRVIGFIGVGDRGDEAPESGEIFALYVLSEYYGTGVGPSLMRAGLAQLNAYPQICLWVLKENGRAIRFYQKYGFRTDGTEVVSAVVGSPEIRMVLER